MACRLAMLFVTFASVGALAGCATYSDSFDSIQHNLSARQHDAALQEIEKQSGSKTDHVLYLLNKGMVLRMKGDFVGSNQALESAKEEMDSLYAASVSENALSFLVNDATVSYAGDDYEQVLVHLYMALNYLELGNKADARVEALQVDIKLREIGEHIPESKFTEDAFSRYLTGLIYEESGEWSDAMIAYRKAYEAYKKYQVNFGLSIPDMLKHDLIRLAQRQGLKNEAAQYMKEFGIEKLQDSKPEQEGELVYILNNGLAPIKREHVVSMWAPPSAVVTGKSKQKSSNATTMPVLVNIALPYYESRPNNVIEARISVFGKQVDTQLMEDIDAIARASLDARMPAITARSIARAIAKGAIQKSVDNAGNGGNNDVAAQLISSLVVRVAAAATERADTRSWLTLPSNIQMARLQLPPGKYDIKVELLGTDGQAMATREYPGVEITRARKTYLSQHWIPDYQITRRKR